MAEAPPRYCGNCGHALEPQDRFCQNCGTPVHQAAYVPTPEADVPVPPPTQAGGAAPDAAQQQGVEGLPPEEPTGRRNLLLGCFALFLLLIVGVIALAGAGGRGGEQAADSPPERNERDEEVTLDPELHMVLKDSQGREFGTDVDAWEFVPTNLNIFLEPINPGVSTNGRVVYQVAPEAKGFTLTLDDVELMEDKSAVFDLGNLPSRSFDPGSASPTATATATATAGQ